jgi:carboxypeptidase N regulatory subunit
VCMWWWQCFIFIGAVETAAACRKTLYSSSKSCTYVGSTKTLDCTDVRLETLETGQLQTQSVETEHLLCGNTQLTKLGSKVFSSVPNLLSLNLSNNFLKVLDFQIFSNLTQLQILDLTNNKLKSLHDELLFKSQENLLSLILANNELTTLDSAVLSPLKSIRMLVLAGNPFVCNCQLSLTMDWCREKGLDTNATCKLPRKYSECAWSVLNTSEICKVTPQMENEVNLNEYASTTERSTEEPRTAERNSETSVTMTIVYVCVTIVLLCVGVIMSVYCRRNCREDGTCKIVKSKNNLIDNSSTDYYTDVSPSPQDMHHLSLPPDLPKRPSPNGTSSKGRLQKSNETELHNYAGHNLAQPDNLISSVQASRNAELPPKSNTLHTTEQTDSRSLYSNSLYVQT